MYQLLLSSHQLRIKICFIPWAPANTEQKICFGLYIHRDILQSFNAISKLKKSLRFERSNFFRLQLKGEEAPALFLPSEQAISDQWYRLQLGLTDPTEQVYPTFLPEDETRFILQNVVIS
jgi:hypothetical protein